MAIKAKSSFSLKDQLFNEQTLRMLTDGLCRAWPEFERVEFEKKVLARFPELELKDRIRWIVTTLHDFLPSDFPEALGILRSALPPPLDPTKTDDDFGHFIFIVPGDYVAAYGCSEAHLHASLEFLREATMRFTSENAIRPFLKNFPDETMEFVRRCAGDDNYHVRRLASEGIRPFLPWAERVLLPPKQIVEVLDRLHGDATRYVTRSVCNTLNDLSKDHADLVLETLARWKDEGTQEPNELAWMTNHALRTLVKRDHAEALQLLGYAPDPEVEITEVKATPEVSVGESFEWSCDLASPRAQRLKVGLKIYFQKANGSMNPKAFAIKDLDMKPGERVKIKKRQPFKPITTRVLYPGAHRAELVVNGSVKAARDFVLLDPS